MVSVIALKEEALPQEDLTDFLVVPDLHESMATSLSRVLLNCSTKTVVLFLLFCMVITYSVSCSTRLLGKFIPRKSVLAYCFTWVKSLWALLIKDM